MSESRNYPPSELKLERLRRAGVIPRSSDVSSFGIVLGLVLSCCALVSGAGEAVVSLLKRCLSGACSTQAPQLVAEGASVLLAVNALVLLLIVGCLLLADLVQNRALFTTGAWGFRAGRAFSAGENLASLRRGLATAVLKNAVFITGWLGVAYLLFVAAFQGIIPDVTIVSAPAVEQPHLQFYRAFAVQVLIASVSASFFFALLSWFLAVLQFRREHSMSRSELEQEYREMEAAPELRRARQEVRDT